MSFDELTHTIREADKMIVEQQADLGRYLRTVRERISPEAEALGSWKRLPIRRGRRVTQEEMAEAVGVSRNWYRRLENGDSVRASMKLLDRIAHAFALTSEQRIMLFVLAIPEILEAHEDRAELQVA